MNKGNKIDINKIGSYEITLAKCGYLQLIAVAFPVLSLFKYEIISNDERVYKTIHLHKAIEKYNELAQ